jgi:hypothetical protein
VVIVIKIHVLCMYFFWSCLGIVQGQFTLTQRAFRNDSDGGCCSAGKKLRFAYRRLSMIGIMTSLKNDFVKPSGSSQIVGSNV